VPATLARIRIVRSIALSALVALGFGCASTDVTNINRTAPDDLPRPQRILVYDVVATLDDVPPDSSLAGYVSDGEQEQTPEEIELGRELGAQIAKEITASLRDLGLPAMRATATGVDERLHDMVIRSGFVDVDKGNMALRVLIGFGAGANDLQTHFEVYSITEQGRVPVGTAGITAAGGRMPGMLLSMGLGGLAKGAAVGGGLAAGKEFTSESLQGAAQRTAEEFMKEVKPGLVKRGWVKE